MSQKTDTDLIGPPFFAWIHPANTSYDSVVGIEFDDASDAVAFVKAEMLRLTGREPEQAGVAHFYDEQAELWADVTDAMPF